MEREEGLAEKVHEAQLSEKGVKTDRQRRRGEGEKERGRERGREEMKTGEREGGGR